MCRQLSDLQFVKVRQHEDPAFDGIGAIFSVSRPPDVVDEPWELIDSHFRRLKLMDRYDERGNDELAGVLSNCREFRDAGGQNAQDFLSGRAQDRAGFYGKNHWIPVRMNATAHHTNLEAWIDIA